MAVTILDIKQNQVTVEDVANKQIVNMIKLKTVRHMMHSRGDSANWSADRTLKYTSYPFLEGILRINRWGFKHQVGDVFLLNSTKYGYSQFPCRVMSIKEAAIDSEAIIVGFMEDIENTMQGVGVIDNESDPTESDFTIDDLTKYKIIEVPYFVVGEERVAIVPIAGREKGLETGFIIYMSLDGGSSYESLSDVGTFGIHGVINNSNGYPENIPMIDNLYGFEVNFSLESEVADIETITRASLMGGNNFALIGNEIINFQTITPVSGSVYRIDNIIRGRYDTVKQSHAQDTDFWFLGASIFYTDSANFVHGQERHFKMVAYNQKYEGELSTADPIIYTFVSRAFKPYIPSNLRVNGVGQNATYTSGGDCVLTWSPRVREGQGADPGAGYGDPDSLTDVGPPPDYEGYFEVEVWVGSVLKRTTTPISAITWTYTNAMNVADNGSPANEITFKLLNAIDTDGVTYESDQRELIVTKI